MNHLFISKEIYSGQVLWQKSSLTKLALDKVLAYTRRQQQKWCQYPLHKRFIFIEQIKKALINHQDDLSRMISEEVGRTLKESRAEIDKSIRLISYCLKTAEHVLHPQIVQTQASFSEVVYEPLGVILAVMPWNYPIWQPLRVAIPTLCAGNGCLIKPAPTVGRISEFLIEHLPKEIPLGVILLDEDTVKYAIARTDGLAFTGSVDTGRLLASSAGAHLKKTVLELGGSNPILVFEDADIKQAAFDICYSRFRDAGQSCNAAKRVIVLNKCAEQLLSLILAQAKKIHCGNPLSTQTQMGPLHLPNAALHMHSLVNEAISKGAICRLGGLLPKSSVFYPPTVLEQVPLDARVWQEEVFGPVLPIAIARDEEEAIIMANQSDFGLAAAIYTKDLHKAKSIAKRLQVGSVYINRYTSSDIHLPFGGIKNSGYGRELSQQGFINFVNMKSYWQK